MGMCVKFWGDWDKHFPVIEFAYHNIYQSKYLNEIF